MVKVITYGTFDLFHQGHYNILKRAKEPINTTIIQNELQTNLEKKIDAGADAIFTQLFFENEKFYEFREKLERKGIKTPIIAGIMPIFSLQQLYKMTTLARVTIPENFLKKIKQHENDKNYIRNLGIEFAIAQCRDLLNNNVKGLHFFTLNKSFSTSEILKNIL